jgi:hypothetical protein
MLGAIKKLAPNFAYTLDLSGGGETTSLTPRLLHRKTGEVMMGSSYLFETPKGSTPQMRASEVTYYKRLVTSCFFGIACDTDNDCCEQTPEVIQHKPAPAPAPRPNPAPAQNRQSNPAPSPAPVNVNRDIWNSEQQEKLSAFRSYFETEKGKAVALAYNAKAKDFNALLVCKYGANLPFHKNQEGKNFMFADDAEQLIAFLNGLVQKASSKM